MLNIKSRCPICGYGSVECDCHDIANQYGFYSCDVCGQFIIDILRISSHKLAPYLFYNSRKKSHSPSPIFFIGDESDFDKIKNSVGNVALLTREAVDAWYETTNKNKANELLRILSTYTLGEDGYIELKREEMNSAFFLDVDKFDMRDGPVLPDSGRAVHNELDRNAQLDGVFNEFDGLIEQHCENKNKIKILPKGLEKLKRTHCLEWNYDNKHVT